MAIKLNISIDDISPHPRSSVKVLDRCFELLAIFPDMKFTLFVPMAYTRLGEVSYSVADDPGFCDVIKQLPVKNFELGWHGLYHGIMNKSNNDEFSSLSFMETEIIIGEMFSIAETVGLGDLFKPIFRPPAFRMSPQAIRCCKKCFNVLCLSSKPNIKPGYMGEDENCQPSRVVYYNVNPPFDPLRVFDKIEVVYHACEWDKNYLDKEKSAALQLFIEEIPDIEYVFMENL